MLNARLVAHAYGNENAFTVKGIFHVHCSCFESVKGGFSMSDCGVTICQFIR